MMKRINKYIGLTLILLISLNNVNATHIAGVDMTYKCIGKDTFVFTFTKYRDCGGMEAFPNAALLFESSCLTNDYRSVWAFLDSLNPNTWFDTGNKYDSSGNYIGPDSTKFWFDLTYLNPPYGTEISQLCPTDIANSRCNGGSLPGMQAWIFQDTIVLPPCSDWLVGNWLWARNNSVNSPASSNNWFYSEVELNSVLAPTNSSPVFNAQPIPYVCVNQDVSYDYSVTESDGDSLHFSLISARANHTNQYAYTSPYSGTNPIDGITVNPNTGQIKFVPTTQGNFIVVLKVEEYDDNDSLIGTAMRDIQFVVIACSNQSPYDTSGVMTNVITTGTNIGDSIIEICAGGSFSFDAYIRDPNAGNTVDLLSNISSALPGATFTKTTGNPAKASVSWTDPGNSPYVKSFVIMADDGNCPTPGQQYYTYEIHIIPGTSANNAILCDSTGSAPLKASGGNTFTWSVISGDAISVPANFSCNPCSNPIASPDTTTIYEVTSDLVSVGCKTKDTITVTVLDSIFDPTITQVGPFCITDVADTLKAVSSGGTWSGPGITNTTLGIFNPTNAGTGTHNIRYLLAGMCGDTDSVSIVVNANPNVIITAAGPFCLSDAPFTLQAVPTGGTWSGTGVNTSTGVFTPSVADTGTHVIRYSITSGTCSDKDSIYIIVNDIYDATITQAGPFCEFDPAVDLTAIDKGGVWSGAGITNSSNGTFNPDSAGIGTHTISYTIANTCGDSDTMVIVVNKQYDAKITQAGPFCEFDPAVDLTVIDTGGVWTGTGITDSKLGIFSPSSAGSGNHKITYTIAGTCGDNNNITIVVNSSADPTITPAGPYCETEGTKSLISEDGGGTWSGNGVSGGTFNPTSAGPGTHEVIYAFSGGCGTADTIDIIVNANPDATINPVDTMYEVDEPITLTSVTAGGTWSGDGITNTVSGTFDPGVAKSGSHIIFHTITDANGCTNTKSTVIFVKGKSALEFPNVITPNDDGKNDKFKAIPDSTEGIVDFHVVIYDRWGLIIYELTAVDQVWDGYNTKGNPVPDGVYYYVCTATGEDDVTYDELHGHITLIRE